MIRGVNLKLIAICLMMLFIFQIVFPTVSFALTGGPSQPETTAFTPVGASELVNLTTGDFSYSIPLITVPGPNGGESLTLGYDAGVTMEQEASWVGLGWNLSVGAINRNLRGLPDDFKGETIQKIHKQKKRKITSRRFSIEKNLEILGQKLPFNNGGNIVYTIDNYYNDFLGYGISYSDRFGIFGLSAGLNFTKDGLTIPVNLSASMNRIRYGLGLSFGGMQSLQAVNFNATYTDKFNDKWNCKKADFRYGLGSNYSFAKVAPIGEILPGTTVISKSWSTSYDDSPSGQTTESSISAGSTVTQTNITYSGTQKNAYGYLYSDYRDENIQDMLDFHKEQNVPFSDATPYLPVPVFDFDTYHVSGNGIGGTFRAYRADVGVLSKPNNVNETESFGGGVQLTSSDYTGVDVLYGETTDETGQWKGHSSNFHTTSNAVGFKESDVDQPLYKPFYFQFMGTQNKSNETYNNATEKEEPVVYGIHMGEKEDVWYNSNSTFGSKYNVKSKYGKLSKSAKNKLNYAKNSPREITTGHVSYKTKEELVAENKANKHIYPENKFPFQKDGSGNSYAQNIPYTKNDGGLPEYVRSNNHINEISIHSEGANYVYGLPAYNNLKEEKIYSCKPESHNNHLIMADYTNHDNGFDELQSNTRTPAYAYAYLLTGKYSDNYVDLTSNGPTDDDLGGWVKYNYSTVENFKWRGPYLGASYLKGNISWNKDDKATYTSGEKDIHYLNSVETKTHLAIFELGDRDDNLSARSEAQSNDPDKNAVTNTTSKRSKYLKKIVLYSKNDPEYTSGDITKLTPIKTVYFEYDYSLCKNVPNNSTASGSDPNHIQAHQGGKLTLKKVYFTYGNNGKGALTPYDFTYSTTNPNYSYLTHTNRWGNYQQLLSAQGNTKDFPYTRQDVAFESAQNSNASAWNLTTIKLPSGGEIEIEYEVDDYGYVQDKRAMQMCQIVGTTTGAPTLSSDNEQIMGYDKTSSQDYYVFFKGNTPTMTAAQAKSYFDQSASPWLYFRANVALKGRGNNIKPEPITGYAKWDGNLSNVGVTSSGVGYFKVIPVRFDNGNQPKGYVHPFRKAAVQHYHNRPDLKPRVANLVQQIRTFIKGPILGHLKKGRANRLIIEENGVNKNLIRLFSPTYKKKGGGHRVKSIRVKSSSEVYGQKYSYSTLEGNSSSGVADYEPILGGEENSMREPVNYNDILDQNSQTEGDYYVQKPYLEAFYPAPIVKYSRVEVRNLTPTDLGRTETVPNNGGIVVHEYYTSKDFPVIEKTPGKSEAGHYKDRMVFPFVPTVAREDNKVFSSGAVIILNDMSGKLKSVSTYDGATTSFTVNNAKTKVSYEYFTDSDNPKELDNEVIGYTDDKEFSQMLLAQKQEIYVHQEENTSSSRNISVQMNILPSIPAWPLYPSSTVSKTISQRRTVSTIKVIHKAGILKKVTTVDDGRTTTASNLAFDAYTGNPIVTKVDNDWDKPVYSYNYAGHWKYPALSGKYQNYRAKFRVTGNQSPYQMTSNVAVEEVLQAGDVLKQGSKLFYVTDIDPLTNVFEASDFNNSGNLSSSSDIEVIESGYKNQQDVNIGNFVSLQNPLLLTSSGSFIQDVFTKLVSHSATPSTYISTCDTLDYHVDNATISQSGSNFNQYSIPVNENGVAKCNLYISLTDAVTGSPANTNITYVANSLKKMGNNKYKFSYSYGSNNYTGIIETDCELGCPIDVLHASATELKEEGWTYNYGDVGNPRVQTSPGTLVPLATANVNPYAVAKRGIWLPTRSWVYQIDRKQTGSKGDNIKLNKDGEYKSFNFYKWNKPVTYYDDKPWEWSSEATKYSPYGVNLESKNRINIHSAELYGYNNSVVTAVAANAEYDEIAYDGFETDNFVSSSGANSHHLTGHFTGEVTINKTIAHTGNVSMEIGDCSGCGFTLPQTNFKTVAGKKYHFSVWMYTRGSDGGNVKISQGGTLLKVNQLGEQPNANYFTMPTSYTNSGAKKYKDHYQEIDNWTKIEGTFVATNDYNASNTSNPLIMEFEFSTRPGASGSVLFDDMRLVPANSSVQTYVYNPYTLWLEAVLDDNNYATFYRRNNEGKLNIVKKETEKGVVTLSATRENISNQ